MRVMPKRLDHKEIYAFVYLQSKGKSRREIEDCLGISRATFYRRRKQVDRLEQEAQRLMKAEA